MIQNKQVELRGTDIGGGPIISLKQQGDYSRKPRSVKKNVRESAGNSLESAALEKPD